MLQAAKDDITADRDRNGINEGADIETPPVKKRTPYSWPGHTPD